MFCIGCYFGELNIVCILFKYIDKDVICFDYSVYENNNWKDFYLKNSLLVFVSKNGYLNIVFELIKYGVGVNFCDGFNILLIVVCRNGYFDIVIELINV